MYRHGWSAGKTPKFEKFGFFRLSSMDALLDDDALLSSIVDNDLFFQAPPPRSDSNLSTATTISNSSPVSGFIVIEAFCTFNAVVVHLDYPESDNGWVYRPELGGHSLHRWDLADQVCIVARHSTCAKAMRPREKACRNCEMKKTWRRECKEACNTFFLFALNDVKRSLQLLAPLVYRSVTVSNEEVQMYLNFIPKLSAQRKRSIQDHSKLARMVQLERNLRFSILNGGSGRVSSYCPIREDAGEQLLDLFLDAAEAETTLLDPTEPALDQDADLHASALMAGDDLVEKSVQLSSFQAGPVFATPVRRPMPIVATVISSSLRNRALATDAYNVVVDRLIDFDADGWVCILPSSIVPLIMRFPLAFHGIADLVSNPLVSHLYDILSIEHDPLLVLKSSVLQLWLQQISLRARDTRVRIGFVSMPSLQIYQDVRTQPLLPRFLTESEVHVHDTFALAASASIPGSLPLMCAYYSPHAPNRVFASNMLPIGF
jgi:hypothetical protein